MAHAHVHFRVPGVTVRDSEWQRGDQERMRAGAEHNALPQRGGVHALTGTWLSLCGVRTHLPLGLQQLGCLLSQT